jgi:hypothetical protein
MCDIRRDPSSSSRMPCFRLILIVSVIAAPLSAAAAVPRLPATHIDRADAPRVDGALDDAIWQRVPGSDSFMQKYPEEAVAPIEPTTVRVAFDDRNLYIAIDCVQQKSPVVARLTRRDRVVESDRVIVDLDTRHDGRTAFHFDVSAAGVLVDGVHFDDTDVSYEWDEVWDGRAARTSTGWSVEIAVPLRILRFPDLPDQIWGFQVQRFVSARQELDQWAFSPRDAGGEVSRYGELGPLDQLGRGHPVEWRPFALGEFIRRDKMGDVPGDTDPSLSVGLDVKWHLGADLTLDAAILPDFGQVEADQIILNLETYELEFPEKRPFFQEGLDVFSTPIGLLYTRRIGAPVEGAADPAPIWGATKLVGDAGPLRVGLLAAMTGGVDVTETGMTLPAAEPSLFLAGRSRLRFGGLTGGLLATSVTRFEPEGADAFRDAYAGGLDLSWRSPEGDYVLDAQAAGTLFAGGPPRVLRDGTVVGDGDLDGAASIELEKEGGRWRFDLVAEIYGRRFDPNDVGFLTRANVEHVELDLERHDAAPRGPLLENQQRIELFGRRNLDGLKLSEGYQINASGQFKNYWSFFVELHWRRAHFDDREVGDGTALERAGLVGLELEVGTDPRAVAVFGLSSTWQLLENGVHVGVEAPLTLRLVPQLDLELVPEAGYTSGEPRVLDAGAMPGTYLLGALEARDLGVTVRATWTFTPRLTLQTYAQLFVAAVRFSDFTTGMGPLLRLDELMPTPAPAESPDFAEGALNASAVLRWEYRPGATLFLVYTRSQTPVGDDGEPMLDVGAVARAPGIDAFLMKISYFWN